MELNCLGRYFHSNLCCVQLSHSSFYGIGNLRVLLILCFLHCSCVYQILGSLYLGSHICQLELCVLECADGTSELLTLFYIVDGGLQSTFCQTQCLCSDTDTAAIQGVHCDVEALALLAQKVFLRDTAIREDQLVSGGSADTHLVFLGTESKSRSTFFYDECGDLFHHLAALLNLAGYSEDHVYISFLTVGDEALGAVEYPLVTIQNSLGLLSLSIGTCARLGQTESTKLLALCKGNQVFLLLLFGTECHDRVYTQRGVCGYDNTCGTANLGKFLYTHGICQRICALSAVLLRNGNAQKSVSGHLLNRLTREAFFFVYFLCKRLYFVLGELSEQLSRHLMFFVQCEIHDLY